MEINKRRQKLNLYLFLYPFSLIALLGLSGCGFQVNPPSPEERAIATAANYSKHFIKGESEKACRLLSAAAKEEILRQTQAWSKQGGNCPERLNHLFELNQDLADNDQEQLLEEVEEDFRDVAIEEIEAEQLWLIQPASGDLVFVRKSGGEYLIERIEFQGLEAPAE